MAGDFCSVSKEEAWSERSVCCVLDGETPSLYGDWLNIGNVLNAVFISHMRNTLSIHAKLHRGLLLLFQAPLCP